MEYPSEDYSTKIIRMEIKIFDRDKWKTLFDQNFQSDPPIISTIEQIQNLIIIK